MSSSLEVGSSSIAKETPNQINSQPFDIFNCHIHTFTSKDVPVNFPSWVVARLFSLPFAHSIVRGLLWLILLIPRITTFVFSPTQYTRLLNWHSEILRSFRLIDRSKMGSQEEIFNEIQKSYPANTKFVVLPMDMKLMGAGPVRGDLDKQHMDLIAVSKKYPGQIVSFCTVDPRREDALERVKRYHELGCVGIKIYPNLGYLPTCPMLMDIYEYAQDHDMPIMAHCSPGGLLSSEMPREKAADLSHPRHYHSILKRYTNLRICLAHYGGNEEWQKYLMEDPSYQTNNPINQEETRNRLALISEMLHDYENLYTDISYTIFQFQQNISLLRVLLSDPVLQKKVLFGSDYYMIEREQMTEREVYFQLRATLGEELFRQIAEINPRLYLGGNWS